MVYVTETQINLLVAELKNRIEDLESAPPGSVPSASLALSTVNLNANTTGGTVPVVSPSSPPSWLSVASNQISLTAGTYMVLLNASMTSTAQRPNVGWRFDGVNRHGGNYIRAAAGHNEAGDALFWRVVGPITSTLQSYRQSRAGTVSLDASRSELTIIKLG